MSTNNWQWWKEHRHFFCQAQSNLSFACRSNCSAYRVKIDQIYPHTKDKKSAGMSNILYSFKVTRLMLLYILQLTKKSLYGKYKADWWGQYPSSFCWYCSEAFLPPGSHEPQVWRDSLWCAILLCHVYYDVVLIYYSDVLNKVSCYTVLVERCCDALQYPLHLTRISAT